VSGACLIERISKGRKQPLILHADNDRAMRAATLESQLEELGVFKSISRPRDSNDNPYLEFLFWSVKHRPDYRCRQFAGKDEVFQWVASFYWAGTATNTLHKIIKFVMLWQRHGEQSVEICRHRDVVYEQARQRNSRWWARSIHCCNEPEVDWINQPPDDLDQPQKLPLLQIA
jgi:hypothetical protein